MEGVDGHLSGEKSVMAFGCSEHFQGWMKAVKVRGFMGLHGLPYQVDRSVPKAGEPNHRVSHLMFRHLKFRSSPQFYPVRAHIEHEGWTRPVLETATCTCQRLAVTTPDLP